MCLSWCSENPVKKFLGINGFWTKKLKGTVNGGTIMMLVDVSSSSSSDGVERLLLLLVFICVTGYGRMEEVRVSDTLCSVQIIRGTDKV